MRIGAADGEPSGDPSLSADGNRMIFTSAGRLVAADTNTFTDLYFIDDVFGARTITRLVATVNPNALDRDDVRHPHRGLRTDGLRHPVSLQQGEALCPA